MTDFDRLIEIIICYPQLAGTIREILSDLARELESVDLAFEALE